MFFEVIDDSSGNVLVSESFTLYVTDCSDVTSAGLSFHADGPIIDTLNKVQLTYDWTLTYDPLYQMTL